MARPSPDRLELGRYPWRIDVLPRFGDMDALRHLNNVSIARIYEDARARFQHANGTHEVIGRQHGLLIAEVSVQYLHEGQYPDPLVVACGIGRIGRTSYALLQALFQRGRCIGTAEVTLVHIDRAGAGPSPLPEAVRDMLAANRFDATPDDGVDQNKEPADHA